MNNLDHIIDCKLLWYLAGVRKMLIIGACWQGFTRYVDDVKQMINYRLPCIFGKVEKFPKLNTCSS